MQLIVVIALIGVAMLQPTKSQNITEPKKAITPRALPNQALDGIAFDEIVVESNLNIRQKPLPPMRRIQRNPNSSIRAKRQFDGFFPQQQFNHHGGYNGGKQQQHGHNGQQQQNGHNGHQHDFNGQQQQQGFNGQHQMGFNGNQQQQGFNGQQQYPGFVQQQPYGALNNPHYGGSSSSSNANSQSSGFGPQGFGSSAASAQAQGFEADGPFGGFGASATNADTQSFQVGPNGFQGAGGLSGSQVYRLPNGHTLNLAYTDGFSVGPDGRPTSANSNSITFNRR